jgi:hypothetical protein
MTSANAGVARGHQSHRRRRQKRCAQTRHVVNLHLLGWASESGSFSRWRDRRRM